MFSCMKGDGKTTNFLQEVLIPDILWGGAILMLRLENTIFSVLESGGTWRYEIYHPGVIFDPEFEFFGLRFESHSSVAENAN